MTPEKMIELLLSDESEGESFSGALYGAFWRGFPLENLRRLLLADNDNAIATGAYLVYELGWPVHPLVPEIVGLLEHKVAQVRFDAIYALCNCTTRNDGKALGRAFVLLDDPVSFVHRGVIMFVQKSEDWKLCLAIANAARLRPGTVFETVIAAKMLSHENRVFNKAMLKELVSHADPIVRRFAAGMAVRPRAIVDEDFLDIGAACNDEEGVHAVDWARDLALPNCATHARMYFRYKPPAPTTAQVDLARELEKSGKKIVDMAYLLRVDRIELRKALSLRKFSEKKKAQSPD